jgi:calcium/proton exchanger cax
VAPVSDNMRELGDLAPQRRISSIAEDQEEPAVNGLRNDESAEEDDDDDSEEPQMTLAASIGLLCLVTALVSICSEFLVDSIQEVTRAWGINVSFVGIILIPIVGNAAEHATAVTVAMKDKMDLGQAWEGRTIQR